MVKVLIYLDGTFLEKSKQDVENFEDLIISLGFDTYHNFFEIELPTLPKVGEKLTIVPENNKQKHFNVTDIEYTHYQKTKETKINIFVEFQNN
ncbi:hypothetical protein [Nostoc sp. CCY 9925]|uniref:hypothetical protein n=1 Tax=Nostoc sp. CCY 9925 TaxID=3103865 RepID=UPI0039C6EEAA